MVELAWNGFWGQTWGPVLAFLMLALVILGLINGAAHLVDRRRL